MAIEKFINFCNNKKLDQYFDTISYALMFSSILYRVIIGKTIYEIQISSIVFLLGLFIHEFQSSRKDVRKIIFFYFYGSILDIIIETSFLYLIVITIILFIWSALFVAFKISPLPWIIFGVIISIIAYIITNKISSINAKKTISYYKAESQLGQNCKTYDEYLLRLKEFRANIRHKRRNRFRFKKQK